MKVFYTFFISFLISTNIFAISIGDKAPDFTLKGSDGKMWKLSELKGKTVVLEWYNDGCPFVRKHYDPSNMQNLQGEFKEKVTWLSISSSAPGKQGYLANSKKAQAQYQTEKMKSTAILLDGESGSVGRAYAAKTTPQIVVINPKGLIAYNGAIDSVASADSSDIKGAVPYAQNAISAVLTGSKVPHAQNKSYGCSVKY